MIQWFFVEDCQVGDVLFQMRFNVVWQLTAYVILKSADDVAKAVAKDGQGFIRSLRGAMQPRAKGMII